MKRFLVLLTAAVLLAAGCQPKIAEPLKVDQTVMNFDEKGGIQTLSITSSEAWTLKQASGGSWCIPSKVYGKSSSTVTISVTANPAGARTAEMVVSAPGSEPVTVTVNQAANPVIPVEKGEFYPDTASGIEVDPVCPDADKPATIKFNPAPGNKLYGHKGELYAHLGVVVEGDWQYVASDWGVANEKVHFRKVADNSWELKLEPTVREYFKSGTTPIDRIAIIVRSEDGNVKSHEKDQFCSVTDNKYEAEVFIPDPVVDMNLPGGAEYGINYNADGSVTFAFYDKDKNGKSHEYCYIVGDWNEWKRVKEGAMFRDDAKGCWWITLDGFDADREYRFQYRLGTSSDSDIYVSDPYTEIVYDQWDDKYIKGVPSFPAGAKALVSAFRINRPVYPWQVPDFKVEDKNDLVIYEMLFRDFTVSHDIEGALAELDYIENLGVNAVELMPVQEFDGNISWGYNPNHWFALDKYYGTREEYKQFIDECHKRGLAVIIDVVYNHATGLHPWTKLYWNSSDNSTAANNPWFNVAPAHPYNVYHDMNHENLMVRNHVKKSLEYLLEEYKVDGFRFDLTKGFTQKRTDPNVDAWGRYDQSRVDILKDYADHIWTVNEDAVVIFEHLSDWDEEKVLADYGIRLWRNVNGEYRKAVGGGSGNFNNMYSTSPFGGYVGYMESHDEERLCSGVTGNDALEVAMRRAGASAAFFLTVPGPKMIWQFGEIGYDYSIEYNGRTGEKPVVTDKYMAEPSRKALYDTYSTLLKFRRENPRFFDSDADFSWTPSGNMKKITCSVDGKTFHVAGNFGKASASYTLPSGTWNDYINGGTVSGTITLEQGEFRLLTSF